jgi:hypothetical protein
MANLAPLKGRSIYSRLESIPAPYMNIHSQHHEHPKLAAFIIFMAEWEPISKIAIGE